MKSKIGSLIRHDYWRGCVGVIVELVERTDWGGTYKRNKVAFNGWAKDEESWIRLEDEGSLWEVIT